MSFVISLEEYIQDTDDTELRIPDCITKISGHAIPENITSVVIPKSVTDIETNAFDCGEDLLSITVDSDNPVYCDIDGVLYSKDKRMLVRYPCGRKNAEFVIPNHVTEIGERAFVKCNGLRSVTLPDSVTIIGMNAFSLSGLVSIHLPVSIKTIVDGAFWSCHELTSINLPEGLTRISLYAFVDCKKLETVCIPRSITAIHCRTFWNCHSLTSVLIPDSVTEIADDAFLNCEHLTIVTTSGSYADEYAQRNGFGVSYDL